MLLLLRRVSSEMNGFNRNKCRGVGGQSEREARRGGRGRRTGEGRSEATELTEAVAALKLSGEMPCSDARVWARRSGVWFLECPRSHDISFQIPSNGAASHKSHEQASMSRLHLASVSFKAPSRPVTNSLLPSLSLALSFPRPLFRPPSSFLSPRPAASSPSLPSLPLISRSFNSFSPLKALPPSVRLHWPPTYLPRTAPADEREQRGILQIPI